MWHGDVVPLGLQVDKLRLQLALKSISMTYIGLFGGLGLWGGHNFAIVLLLQGIPISGSVRQFLKVMGLGLRVGA